GPEARDLRGRCADRRRDPGVPRLSRRDPALAAVERAEGRARGGVRPGRAPAPDRAVDPPRPPPPLPRGPRGQGPARGGALIDGRFTARPRSRRPRPGVPEGPGRRPPTETLAAA